MVAAAEERKLAAMRTANEEADLKEQMSRRRVIQALWDWLPIAIIITATVILLFAGFLVLLVVLTRLGMMETTRGVLMLVVPWRRDVKMLWEPPVYRQLTAGESPDVSDDVIDNEDSFVLITANGRTQLGKEMTDAQKRARSRAIAFLSRAARVAAEHEASATIPTDKQMGMYARTWGYNVKALKPYVVTQRGRGGSTTCVDPYGTLGALLLAIGRGDVVPAPLSPAVDLTGRQKPLKAVRRALNRFV
jgi:hypothetical protein